jgi:hypothetical protein
MTLQYTGGLDQLTKLPGNSLIREKTFSSIVMKFDNLGVLEVCNPDYKEPVCGSV